MTTDDRLATLERQMAEVRAALFLDDPGLRSDLVGSGVDAQIAAWGAVSRAPVARETWVGRLLTRLSRLVLGDERKTR